MSFRFETDVVHGGQHPDTLTGALTPPIYQTSTFAFENVEQGSARFSGKEKGYMYTRLGNPNTDLLASKVARLEGFPAGIATSSGMAAVANVILASAKAGDSIVVDDTVYGGTHYLVEQDIPKLGIEVIRVDAADLQALEAAVRPNTRLILIETPANPTLKIIDIEAAARIAHEKGALLAVDNTFSSPYLQRPGEFGADIVFHSATKYISGHGDVVAGVLCGEKEFIASAFKVATHYGWTMSPFNAWLLLRGLKTLVVRMERHCSNAMTLAQWLEKHPKIDHVLYPGLDSFPQHELAKKQMKGFGGIISFEMKGGFNAGKALMDHVTLASLAVSLGDCDTLIQHPASMTHAGMREEEMEEAHITPGLVRISVGIEHVDDLIEDLEQALEKID
ncbi:MAG: PLP-dependent transferase [Calditrichaeota bacterium]|nr:PLP-dependent transferase [Calditrichota bacterium]